MGFDSCQVTRDVFIHSKKKKKKTTRIVQYEFQCFRFFSFKGSLVFRFKSFSWATNSSSSIQAPKSACQAWATKSGWVYLITRLDLLFRSFTMTHSNLEVIRTVRLPFRLLQAALWNHERETPDKPSYLQQLPVGHSSLAANFKDTAPVITVFRFLTSCFPCM